MKNKFHILGIESTCDDTGVAIVNSEGKFLSNCLHSQLKLHLHNGGVIPVVAKELHAENIDAVANKAFKESHLYSVAADIDAIAVANRPGLQYSIQVGLDYARKLAKKYSKPLMLIHHMEAHALMPLNIHRCIKFPFISLLLSGGHSLIAIAEEYNKYHLLGMQQDIACGEMLDKVARRLKLRDLGDPFNRISGGASIELLAQRPNCDSFKYFSTNVSLNRQSSDCNMIFSGYWGYIDHLAKKLDELWFNGTSQDYLLDELGSVCASVQRVVAKQVISTLHRSLIYYKQFWRYDNFDKYPEDKSNNETKHLGLFDLRTKGESDRIDIAFSGGCSANKFLVQALSHFCDNLDPSLRLFVPPKNLCNDNGAMIAWNGALRFMDDELNKDDLNNTIIYDPEVMDKARNIPKSNIGKDMRTEVFVKRISLPKMKQLSYLKNPGVPRPF